MTHSLTLLPRVLPPNKTILMKELIRIALKMEEISKFPNSQTSLKEIALD